MKIAFTTKGINWDSIMDPRFGRTEHILIYDTENDQLLNIDNRDVANEAHGAGPQTAKKIFDAGAEIIITGNGPGGNAETILEKTGIKIYTGASHMTVKEAFEKYSKGELTKL